MSQPYVCIAEKNFATASNVTYDHCAQMTLTQCSYCKWYQDGNGMPRFPVPAIIYEVEVYPDPVIEIVEVINYRRCFLRVRFQEPMPWITNSPEYTEIHPGMYYPTEGHDA